MSDTPFRPQDDEPAVLNPRLRELVELARAQRLPPLRSELRTINEGVARQRRGRTRITIAVAVLAAAAVFVLWQVRERPVQLVDRGAGEQAERSLGGQPGGTAVEPGDRHGKATVRDDVEVEAPIVEAPVVEVPVVEAPVVEAPIVEAPVVEALADETPERAVPRKPAPDASELAREAEEAMAQQRRGDAIRALRTLVRRYPSSSAARAALLDLGRLLRADGRRDEARCAYRQLVARWPSDPMRGEIDRVLESLGDGPDCKGLRPQ